MPRTIVFGIDDVCPQKASDAGKDFGGDLEEGVLGKLIDFSKEFPGIKYSLFITPNYAFKAQPRYFSLLQKTVKKFFGIKTAQSLARHWKGEPFRLDKHPDFCSFLKKYSQKGLFSLELHGFNHFHVFLYHPQEFNGLTASECSERIQASVFLFKKVGFEKPMVFAPPGWFVSGALLEALQENAFKFIAGSIDNSALIKKDSFSKGSGLQGVSAFKPQKVNGLKNIPRNWDLRFGSKEKALKVFELNGILGIQAHIAEEGVTNAITDENLNNLRSTLFALEKEYGNLRFSHFRSIK